MIAVVARLFALIIAIFVVISAVIGGVAYFKTRKWLGKLRENEVKHTPPHASDAKGAKVIEGEYKVLNDDENKT